ncbi:MAG TPA: class I SAM-dependent methyltransferase [Polyangiaceae bacterium]|nr:class I SAM-dependent methyltransferase [Polyangiaceae bacterium]
MSTPSDLDPTGRFSNRADDYVRYRPTYPAPAIDALVAGLGAPERLVAVDVGAGTGISARLLAERGVRVSAVEPNRAMREAAAPHPGVTWLDGTAEAIPLADASVDLALAAQAFHWFRAPEAVAEMARVTKSGGRLALLWNHRSPSDPFMRGYEDVIVSLAADRSVVGMNADVAAVDRSGLFGPRRVVSFEHRQTVDRDGLVGRALSASYVPKDEAGRARLVELLSALHARFAENGLVSFVYVAEVTLAERLPR